MTQPKWIPADGKGLPLKREGAALDSRRAMRTQELKLRIERADYVVDPVAVAEAMLRHAVSQRRWWNPVGACATPSSASTTSAGPAATDPTHVSRAAPSAAERSPGPTHTQSS